MCSVHAVTLTSKTGFSDCMHTPEAAETNACRCCTTALFMVILPPFHIPGLRDGNTNVSVIPDHSCHIPLSNGGHDGHWRDCLVLPLLLQILLLVCSAALLTLRPAWPQGILLEGLGPVNAWGCAGAVDQRFSHQDRGMQPHERGNAMYQADQALDFTCQHCRPLDLLHTCQVSQAALQLVTWQTALLQVM